MSDASQERNAEKLEKLGRIFERLSSIEVTIDLEDPAALQVDVKVSAEHKHDFVAHHQSDNLMGSIDTVVHRLEQQLRKYKERVQDRHRNSDPRHHEAAVEPEGETE